MTFSKGAIFGAITLLLLLMEAPAAWPRDGPPIPQGGPQSYAEKLEAYINQEGVQTQLDKLAPLVDESLSAAAIEPAAGPKRTWMPDIGAPDDENLLIFTVRLKSSLLSDGLFAYPDSSNSQRYFLPLQDFARMIELALICDGPSGMAKGWTVEGNEPFTLNAKAGWVQIGQTKTSVPKDAILLKNNVIYVRSDLLEKWFPILFNFDFSDLNIKLTALRPLPVTLNKERQKKYNNKHLANNAHERPDYPVLRPAYSFMNLPFVHVDMSYGYNRSSSGTGTPRFNTTLTGVGTVAEKDMYLSISDNWYSSTKPIVRLRLSQEDANGRMLEGLNATYYALGDVTSRAQSAMSKSASGRGFSLTNLSRDMRGDNLSVTLRGELSPGYQVDLERNGTLIDFRREPDENGQYVFENVPAFAGANEYQLVFYSPQGQITRKTERIFADDGGREPDTLGYSLVVFDQNKTLINSREENDPDDGRTRVHANFEYGIRKHLKLFGGFNSFSVNNVRQRYLNAGVHASNKYMVVSAQAILSRAEKNPDASELDNSDGHAFDVQAEMRLAKFNVQGEYEYYRGLINERLIDDAQNLEGNLAHSLEMRINGPFKIGSKNFSLLLQNTYLRDTQSEYQNTSSVRLSTFVRPLNLSLEARQKFTSVSTAESYLGTQIASRVGDAQLRGQIEFKLAPRVRLNRVDLYGDYPLSERVGMRAGLSRSGAGNDAIYTLSGGYTYKLDDYNLGFALNANDQGSFSGLFSLNFGLAYDPYQERYVQQAENFVRSGAASVFSFADNNQNGVYDPGYDDPLEGVHYRGDFPNYGRKDDDARMLSDAKGFVDLVGMGTYQENLVEVDEEKLPDMLLKPDQKGFYVAPRPGRFVPVAFPFLRTGEVDGSLQVMGPDGEPAPLPGIKIRLKNAKYSFETISEFDGFIYFTNVPLGTYKLFIDRAQVKGLGYLPEGWHRVRLTRAEPYVSAPEIVLVRAPLFAYTAWVDDVLFWGAEADEAPMRVNDIDDFARACWPELF